MGRLRHLIKKSLKSRTLVYDIVSYTFCKLGYGDINLAGQNSRYRAFNNLRRKYAGLIGKNDFKNYSGDEKAKVWICWLQGFDSAPTLVKNCVKSIEYHIKDMEIVYLDKNNIKDYITLPDYIYEKWERGIIPNATFSDIIRLQLLIEHGGLWMDATTYMTDDLPSYVTDGDFFVYHDGRFECEVINMGSWLIYSKANNILLNETQNLMLTYWKKTNYLKQYFLLHLFFRMVSDYYKDEWAKFPYYNQADQHIFMLELNNTYNEKRWAQIKELSPIHKLSYKNINNSDNSYYKHLEELYKS